MSLAWIEKRRDKNGKSKRCLWILLFLAIEAKFVFCFETGTGNEISLSIESLFFDDCFTCFLYFL